MTNAPRIILTLVCLTTLFVATSAECQLLPLLATSDGAEPAAWWVDAGELSPVESALIASLGQQGVPVVNPARLDKRPRISRIYAKPDLSTKNAANLGGLHGADLVLVGTAAFDSLDEFGDVGLGGVAVRIDATLVSVESGETLTRIVMVRRSYGPDARESALAILARDVAHRVRSAGNVSAAPIGLTRDEPYLVVRGLWSQDVLTSFASTLTGLAGVKSARMAWFAEGVVAFDINPGSVDEVAVIEKLAATLAEAPPDGIKLKLSESTVLRASR